jgi:hypothetical protein
MSDEVPSQVRFVAITGPQADILVTTSRQETVCLIIASLLWNVIMAGTTDAQSFHVATLYGHNDPSLPSFNYNLTLRWSEFENLQDEANELEARAAKMAIVHRLSGESGSWYVCSRFLPPGTLAALPYCTVTSLGRFLFGTELVWAGKITSGELSVRWKCQTLDHVAAMSAQHRSI